MTSVQRRVAAALLAAAAAATSKHAHKMLTLTRC